MSKEAVLERVEKDIANNDYLRARDRMISLLIKHPNDLMIRKKLGDIYYLRGNRFRAGMYWFLISDKNQEMSDAVEYFKDKCENYPSVILDKLVLYDDYKNLPSPYAISVINELIEEWFDRQGVKIVVNRRGTRYYFEPYNKRGEFRVGESPGCMIVLLAIGALVLGLLMELIKRIIK